MKSVIMNSHFSTALYFSDYLTENTSSFVLVYYFYFLYRTQNYIVAQNGIFLQAIFKHFD